MKPSQKTIDFLTIIINDVNEQPVVRHEVNIFLIIFNFTISI